MPPAFSSKLFLIRLILVAIALFGVYYLFTSVNSGSSRSNNCPACPVPRATTCPTTTTTATQPPALQQKEDTMVAKKKNYVISMGLYGSNPRYTFGSIRNAELAPMVFPGWSIRFYTDMKTVPKDVVDRLRELGSEIIPMEGGDDEQGLHGGIGGMFWRFLVADDDTVDAYIVRDADSRLNLREKMAVDEFLASDKLIHVLRDHINHGNPINGGMWGGKRGGLPFKLRDKIKEWHDKNNYFADIHFLTKGVWPHIQDVQLAHDSFFCQKFPNGRPFPSRRFHLEHVGGVYDASDVPRADDTALLVGKEAPMACRGHPSWRLG